jgi:hypothetical protein
MARFSHLIQTLDWVPPCLLVIWSSKAASAGSTIGLSLEGKVMSISWGMEENQQVVVGSRTT